MLQNNFESLCSHYTKDKELISSLWQEIKLAYSASNRHYHTLVHVENVYEQLQNVKDRIKNWDAVLFALYYHDIIYSATKNNNEEKSAGLAQIRLGQLGASDEMILLVVQCILATKSHHTSANEDINYFTDADLSILGESWPKYEAYKSNVRKEYRIYPDIIYKPGRLKVLDHFISMPRIYKTPFFSERFEQSAIANLKKEKGL